jgi:hypothetical protein
VDVLENGIPPTRHDITGGRQSTYLAMITVRVDAERASQGAVDRLDQTPRSVLE